ncbi:MAG: cytidine deaminase [Candidatus Dormibacteraceae bacterium]
MDDADLVALDDRAAAIAEQAYAPYSRFRVGAALRTVAGGVFAGANVENRSYGLAICAERAAVVQAVAAEGPSMRIAAISVHHPGEGECSPCGACRQVLAEFSAPDAVVRYRNAAGPAQRPLAELLPDAF